MQWLGRWFEKDTVQAEKRFLQLCLDFGIPRLASVVWRFQSALGRKKSPTQFPGFAEDQPDVKDWE